LILPDFLQFDSQIIFKNISSFQHTVIGGYEHELHLGNIEYNGSTDIIQMFRQKCLKAGELSSNISTVETPMRENRRIGNSTALGGNGGVGSEEQPLKKGWLLKKRDIISGWKCRYFELFRGRLLYYRDANDMKARGCILLAEADISKVTTLKIKRISDHFGFT
jgi:hypothetical protein